MKPARLAVLGIALAAGGAAALLARGGGETVPVSVPVITEAPSVQTGEVLVVASDLNLGHSIRPGDLRWQPWPADGVPNGAIRKQDSPNALEEFTGAIVRYALLNGEPVRREKVVKAEGAGFMSAILPAGMRAIAINIDTRGSNSAGGFILPNDRVDVLRTYRDDEASRVQGVDVYISETILSNIRVLAIGQNIQERNGEKVVIGETATLELTPGQAELVTLAQKVGQLSLALRSIADTTQQNTTEAIKPQGNENAMTVVRYGISKQTPKR